MDSYLQELTSRVSIENIYHAQLNLDTESINVIETYDNDGTVVLKMPASTGLCMLFTTS